MKSILGLEWIDSEDFYPEKGKKYGRRRVRDIVTTRKWDHWFILFNDNSIAICDMGADVVGITGGKKMYLFSLKHQPVVGEIYTPHIYELDTQYMFCRTRQVFVGKVEEVWKNRLYRILDEEGNRYFVVVP